MSLPKVNQFSDRVRNEIATSHGLGEKIHELLEDKYKRVN